MKKQTFDYMLSLARGDEKILAKQLSGSRVQCVDFAAVPDEPGNLWRQNNESSFAVQRPVLPSPTFQYKKHLPEYVKCFEEIFLHCSGIRRMGSAAIDLSYVAAGRFEGFWEIGLNAWDIAAGAIIIKEAGGIISDFWHNENYLTNKFVIASNGLIHDKFSTIIQKHYPKPFKLERGS